MSVTIKRSDEVEYDGSTVYLVSVDDRVVGKVFKGEEVAHRVIRGISVSQKVRHGWNFRMSPEVARVRELPSMRLRSLALKVMRSTYLRATRKDAVRCLVEAVETIERFRSEETS